MKPIPIPVPLAGLNTIELNLSPDSGYARELTNFILLNGALAPRPAVRGEYMDVNQVNGRLAWVDVDTADADLSAFGIQRDSPGSIIRLYDDTTTGNIGLAAACQAPATTFKHASIEVLCGCGAPRSPAAPGFTSHGFALSVITDERTILSGCSYRGRPYFTNGTTIEYGDLGQVTGTFATDALDGGSFAPTDLMDGQLVWRCFQLTVSSGNEADVVFVVFGNEGKVLVYSGDWPDASNWQLIGSYDMPEPASLCSFVELDGDIIVASVEYPYSLRALISGGVSSAYEARLSKPIENLWRAVRWKYTANDTNFFEVSTAAYIGSIYGTTVETIVDLILFKPVNPGAADVDSLNDRDNICFAYCRQYNAWCVWFVDEVHHPIRQMAIDAQSIPELRVYCLGSGWGHVNSLELNRVTDEPAFDEFVEILASWKTPYQTPFVQSQQRVIGVRPTYQNSQDGYFYLIRSIFESSDRNSPWGFFQDPDHLVGSDFLPGVYGDASLDVPVSSSGVYSAMANPGGAGGSVSFNFVLLETDGGDATNQIWRILGATALVEDGGPLT